MYVHIYIDVRHEPSPPFNLHPLSLHPPITQTAQKAHGDSLISRDVGGCAWLLAQKKHDTLGLMYRLFRREGMVPVSSSETEWAATGEEVSVGGCAVVPLQSLSLC